MSAYQLGKKSLNALAGVHPDLVRVVVRRAMAEIAQRSRAAGGSCERTYDGVRQAVQK